MLEVFASAKNMIITRGITFCFVDDVFVKTSEVPLFHARENLSFPPRLVQKEYIFYSYKYMFEYE